MPEVTEQASRLVQQREDIGAKRIALTPLHPCAHVYIDCRRACHDGRACSEIQHTSSMRRNATHVERAILTWTGVGEAFRHGGGQARQAGAPERGSSAHGCSHQGRPWPAWCVSHVALGVALGWISVDAHVRVLQTRLKPVAKTHLTRRGGLQEPWGHRGRLASAVVLARWAQARTCLRRVLRGCAARQACLAWQGPSDSWASEVRLGQLVLMGRWARMVCGDIRGFRVITGRWVRLV